MKAIDLTLKDITTDDGWFDITKIEKITGNSILIILDKRGVGKTFSCAKADIEQFLCSGERFVYVRQKRDELAHTASRYLNGVLTGDTIFKHDKGVYYLGEKYVDEETGEFVVNKLGEFESQTWSPCGISLPLSSAKKFKGGYFGDIGSITYDEFVAWDGKELENEMKLLNSLIGTCLGADYIGKVRLLANFDSETTIKLFREFGVKSHSFVKNRLYRFKGGGLNIIAVDVKRRDRTSMSNIANVFNTTEYGKAMLEGVERNKWSEMVDSSINLSNEAPHMFLYLKNVYMQVYNVKGVYYIAHHRPNRIARSINPRDLSKPAISRTHMNNLISKYQQRKLKFTGYDLCDLVMSYLTKNLV